MFLDDMSLLACTVGYGSLGLHGALGYDDRTVTVQQQPYAHALSAHPPSLLVWELDARFDELRCQVALDDGVATRESSADFIVAADGHPVAVMPQVRAGDPPRELKANIRSARTLTLLTQTTNWPFSHAVWLEPQVVAFPTGFQPQAWSDCLSRVKLEIPHRLPSAERCIATIASRGYARLLDQLLASLNARKLFRDTLVVVLNVDGDPECGRVIAKHGAMQLDCKRIARPNQTVKAALYSIASLVDARYYICLDADTLVLGDLHPLFDAIEAHPPDSILIARDAFLAQGDLLQQLCTHYRGSPNDLSLLLGRLNGEGEYGFVVNDGVFAGGRQALLGIESIIRNMRHAAAWTDYYPDHGWRNQFIFNLALARLRCASEIDTTYNLQLHMHEVEWRLGRTQVEAWWRGHRAHILHFCGWGREKYLDWRGRLAGGELQ